MSDKTIKAPLPGTFYRQSDPNADPFVTEGDEVKPGDVVGLVEIMKSFHEVKSEDSGVVERFLVENEDTVEAGQDLAVLGG
ncbi:MAG: biotin carboxyl carrier domain-containing protein [Solirubrobacterales bacterium]|nr:biotin carboxyl carrier domain-containing protein [Solirubrobacterales bacterium]MBV9365862.1 biotin carboxyl carrier domain-containing protein [Solirubrobacterales bacterium]MBV9684276.1 biotin carboxyl carrier domain-containing protein [Solirubrobacterales bacterium]MBV9809378.1 biotin carboxyl carrier domain-containing protein [Solirubrobacterales bacterium]